MTFKKGNIPKNAFEKGNIPKNAFETGYDARRKPFPKGNIPTNAFKKGYDDRRSCFPSGVEHPNHKIPKCGELNSFFGKHHSEATKQKIRDKKIGIKLGHVHTEDGKKRIAESKFGDKNPMRNPEVLARVSGENANNWQGGTSFFPYCHKFNNRFKERIRDRDARTCQLCGIKENGVRHSVHHIHHDKDNCYPDVITLCRGCNTIVGSKNSPLSSYYESLFMATLNSRGLLLWTITKPIPDKIKIV